MEINPEFKNKKLIVFDMDGTLTESKQIATKEMIGLLLTLLKEKYVAVIGGGKYDLFKRQLIDQLGPEPKNLEKLFLFPTNSTAFYRQEQGIWEKVYEKIIPAEDRKKIITAILRALEEIGYTQPEKTYGEIIEDRKTQIAFSAVGQEAPVSVKKQWNNTDQRSKIIPVIEKYLPDFEVRSGGLTTIDITEKGIDKAYGLKQIQNKLNVSIKEMLFIGDAIYPGGNDYAVVKTGVDYIKVSGPKETTQIIQFILGLED